MNCLKCSKPMPEQEGPGRPRRFCSTECKKATDLEIRRLNSRIGKLERDESTYRIKGAAGWAKGAAEEIKRLEAHLAILLAAEEE